MAGIESGQLIDGRYRILSRLGSGGMADVYLAEDEQLQRQVALKLLHHRFASDPGFVERFRREAQAAASLQHPHVVSVYDRGSFDDSSYIAMEYLPGRTLKQVIRQEAPIDPIRAIDLTIQILKAARLAHRQGVIHRDLKPHNVIVDDSDQVKVTDFGIARAGASDMTETGSIMGTAQYLSPEQAQGQPVGEPSDLYSIGIVLYELLTGRVPFDAESAVSIALKQVSEPPVPPIRINPNVPAPLSQAVMWSLNKNPSDRPADADQFIGVLEEVRRQILAGNAGEQTASMAAIGGMLAGGAAGALAGGAAGVAAGAAGAGVASGAGPGGPAPAGAAAGSVPPPPGSTHPPGGYPPGTYPPGGYPPAGGAPGTYPPGTYPPGTYPPGTYPPGADWGTVPPGNAGTPDGGGTRWWGWALVVLVALAIAGGVVAFILTRPAKGTVPDVVRESLSVAQAQVQNAGFQVLLNNEPNAAAAQTVIGQNPLGGARLDKNSTVTLDVSTGPGDVSVPSVVDQTIAAAEKTIKQAGLTVKQVVKQQTSSVQAGLATGTDPDAGASVSSGSGVTLFESAGSAPVSVPDVTGDTVATATSALTGAGFVPKVVNQVSSSAQAGTVISQSPAANEMKATGSTVTITVATAPTTASVPSVVGDTANAAASTLKAAGFTVNETTKRTKNPSQDGNVISQDPKSGTTLNKQSAVTIVVGNYVGPATSTTTTGSTTSSTSSTTSSGS